MAANVKPNFKPDRRAGNSSAYLKKIRKLPCCVCLTDQNIQAHHLRYANERGIAMKATDRWAIPLCWEHHLGQDGAHNVGTRLEARWFLDRGVDAFALAPQLWKNQCNEEAMRWLIESHNIKFRRKAEGDRDQPGV